MRFSSRAARYTWVFLCLLVFTASPLLILAQQTVEGFVVDREGRPLKKVKIVFTDKNRGTKFTFTSDDKGKFMKVGIPPAVYVISVRLEGYYPLESEFKVDIGRNRGLKLVMEKIPPRVQQDPDVVEGTRLFQEGKFAEAAELFQKAVEKTPDSIEANYGLALSLLRNGRVDEGIARFKKVQALKPDMMEVYLALGESYFNKGENETALAYFDKALELYPSNAEVYYNIGIIHYKNDRTDEAIQHFSVSKSLDPDYAPTYYQLGLAYIKKGEMDKAIENLEMFLELSPDSPLVSQVKDILKTLKK